MIITISGNPGSGKSTVAKILVQKLNAERVYVGGIRRELALKKGMNLEEFNKYGETHPETDVDIDKQVSEQAREISNSGKNVVVEGRTQYHFIPESFKIYIKVDELIGVKRVWKDIQEGVERNEGNINSLEEMRKSAEQRMISDKIRYQKYYGINPYDESNYDLVIDSSNITAEQVAEKILEAVQCKL